MFKTRTRFMVILACFSFLLLCGTLVFCLSSQSFSGKLDVSYTAPKDFLTYTLNSTEDGWVVTGYDKTKAGNATSLNIPQQHNENNQTLPVVEVAAEAFKDATQFTTLTIGENVQTLGNGAFYGMTNLTEINFNATDMADCSSDSLDEENNIFTYAGTNGSGITVNFGDEVAYVPSSLFVPQSITQATEFENYLIGQTSSINYNLVNLKTLNLNKVQTIGGIAFAFCANLTDIVLPDSVNSVGYESFLACVGVKTLTIGKNVQAILPAAFMGLTNLVEINYNATSLPDYIADDFALSSESGSPDDAISEIGRASLMLFAFAGKESEGITINFGDDVKHIPGLLFSSYSTNLEGMPDGSMDIKNINFNKVETIGAGSFAGSLMNLENSQLVLPEGVTYVADMAFAMSDNLMLLVADAQNRPEDFPSEEELFKYIKDNLSGLNSIHLPKSLKDFGAAISYYTIGLSEMIIDSPDIINMDLTQSNTLKLLSYGIGSSGAASELGLRMVPDIYVPAGSEILPTAFIGIAIEEGVVAKAERSPKPGYDLYRDVNFVVPFYYIYNNNPESVSVTDVSGAPIDGVEEGQEFKITIVDHQEGNVLAVAGANYNEARGTYTAFDDVEVYYASADSLNSLFTFTKINGGYSVKAASKVISGDVEIPENHNGEPVLEIESNGFKNCTGITSITIPNSVTSVGEYAFYNCKNITSVTIGRNVETLGYYSLSGLVNLTEINFNAINMVDYATEEVLTNNEWENNYIFTAAGKDGSGITVNFGDGVTHIPGAIFAPQMVEQYAIMMEFFGDYDSAASMTTEEKMAFAVNNPVNITKINFNQVQTIGVGAFAGALINYEDGKLVLPEGVTLINHFAFVNNSNIAKLLLDGVFTPEVIEAGLKGITSVQEPSSLADIGVYMFVGTYSLNELIIKNATLVAEGYSSLNPYSQMYHFLLGPDLFSSSIKVVDNVYVPEGALVYDYLLQFTGLAKFSSDKPGYDLYHQGIPITNNSDYYLKVTDLQGNEIEGIKTGEEFKIEIINPQEGFNLVVDGATYNSATGTYTAGTDKITVTYEHPYLIFEAVEGGYSVKPKNKNDISGDFVIPASYNNQPVVSISDSAFRSCEITGVTIPSCITRIGKEAFYDCGKLTSVTIPSSVTSIGEGAFASCNKLTSLVVERANQFYTSRDKNGTERNIILCIQGETEGTLIQGSSNFDISNDDRITRIGNYAFRECSGLTGTLTIPSSVTSIGSYAFAYCSGLTGQLTIPSSVTSIGESAFSGCSGLTGQLTIPSSVTSIRESAFSGCSGLTSVIIEEGITIIGGYAFASCSGLTTITISSSVRSIGDWAFANCRELTSVTIPSSVTSIGSDAFRYCIGLTSITIPSSVTSIWNYAFDLCDKLTEVTIESEYAYTKATSTDSSACGGLLSYAKTVRVLTSLVVKNHAYINSTNFPTIETEEDGKYTVYKK